MDYKHQNGFSLISALVSVGIVSIVSLGLAYSIGVSLKGMAQIRNSSLAGEVKDIIGGLVGDSEYCSLSLGGINISGPFPKKVAEGINFKSMNADGTLGVTSIIQVGQKYENHLEVTELNLIVTEPLVSQRYIGSIELNFKGDTGLSLYFNRKVPIIISTNLTNNITNCTRVASSLTGPRKGVYSKTCNDFAAMGWASKMACLQDGKWHHVFSNDEAGLPSFGAVANFANYIQEGADAKVSIKTGFAG